MRRVLRVEHGEEESDEERAHSSSAGLYHAGEDGRPGPASLGVAGKGDRADLLDEVGVGIWSLADNKVQHRDNLTGQPLDPVLVAAARRKELEYVNTKGVWELRPPMRPELGKASRR